MANMDPDDVDRQPQRRLAEALILASPEPLPAKRLADLIPRCSAERARELVAELNAEYAAEGRAFEICEVAGGFQIRTLPEFSPYVQQLQSGRPLRLSPAALETLAVVAWRQPVTRAEVEFVRGVDVGAVLRSLLERKLLRIAGHREVPGRPLLYATTRRFLEVFGLASLDDLPTLREIRELAPEGAGGEPAEEGAGAAGGSGAAAPGLEEADLDPALRAFEEAEPVGDPH
jgi:segregation and condensation protein B